MSIFKNSNWTYVNPTEDTRMYILFKNTDFTIGRVKDTVDNWADIEQYIIIKYEDSSKSTPVDIKIEKGLSDMRLDSIGQTHTLPFDLENTNFKYVITKYNHLTIIPYEEGGSLDTKFIDIQLYNLLDLQMNKIISNIGENKPWEEGLNELGYNKPVQQFTRNFKLYHHEGIEFKLYKEIADYLGFKHDTPFVSVLDKQVYTIDNLDPEIDLDTFLKEGHIVQLAQAIERDINKSFVDIDDILEDGMKQAGFRDRLAPEPKKIQTIIEDKWSEIIPRKKEELVHFTMRLNSYNGQNIDNIMDSEMYKVYDGSFSSNTTNIGIKNILLTVIKEDLKEKKQSDSFINTTTDRISVIIDNIIEKSKNYRSLYDRRCSSFIHVKEDLEDYLNLVGNIYLDLLYYLVYTNSNTSVISNHYNVHRKIFKYYTHGDVITSLDKLYSGKKYTMSLFLNEMETDFNTKPASISLLSSYGRLFDDVGNRIAEKNK